MSVDTETFTENGAASKRDVIPSSLFSESADSGPAGALMTSADSERAT